MTHHPATSGPLRPQQGVVARRLGEGVVLVHLPTNRIFELNETGARLWELVADGKDIDGIVAQLATEFAVEPDVAEHEVAAVVARLQREGLLRA